MTRSPRPNSRRARSSPGAPRSPWIRAIKLVAQIYDEAPEADREQLEETLRAMRGKHRALRRVRGQVRRLYDETADAHLDRLEDKPVEYLCNVIKGGLALFQEIREELEEEPRRLTERDLHDLALADLKIRQAQAVIRKRYGTT